MSNTEVTQDRRNMVIPSLMFKDTTKAIDFYKQLFDAKELYRVEYKGKIVHAEILIGSTVIMMGDEMPQMKLHSAETLGDTPITLYAYVDNVDKVFKKAVDMGVTIEHPLETQFYGDRIAAIKDPYGFKWTIATQLRQVTLEEIKNNMDKFMNEMDDNNTTNNNFNPPSDMYKQKYLKYRLKYMQLKNGII